MPKFKMIGSNKFGGKEYTLGDVVGGGFVSPEAFGLPNFYGGRVKKLGKVKETKSKGIYLCLEDQKVIDIIQFEEEPVEREVAEEPKYADDVPPEKKVPHKPNEKTNLPRKK